jgi:hypothetical protein
MSPCGMREVTKCTGFRYPLKGVGIAREEWPGAIVESINYGTEMASIK